MMPNHEDQTFILERTSHRIDVAVSDNRSVVRFPRLVLDIDPYTRIPIGFSVVIEERYIAERYPAA
jgi:hypothetical protein